MDLLCIIGGALLVLIIAKKQSARGFVVFGWTVLSVGVIWFVSNFWWGYQLSRNLLNQKTSRTSQQGTIAEKSNCHLEQWKWRNWGLVKDQPPDGLIVEGIVTAPADSKLIYIQAFDGNGNFLGTIGTILEPGGSFHGTLAQANPTSELKIKYFCDGSGPTSSVTRGNQRSEQGTFGKQTFRVSNDLGTISSELCSETLTDPETKRPLCYMRNWKRWLMLLIEQVAGADYAALQRDSGTQSPAEQILEFPNKRRYVIFQGCREHFCSDFYAYFLVDPVNREIDIIWIGENDELRFLGPNAEILKRTNAFGWLCAYSAQRVQQFGQFAPRIPVACRQ